MKREIAINSPCTEDWEKMKGNKAVRNCKKCRFNVYNFAEMSEEQIDKILTSSDKVCVRLYIRPDGTYLTKDCKKKVKRKKILKYLGLAALIPLSFALFKSNAYQTTIDKARNLPVIGKIINYLHPPEQLLVGEACILPKPPPQNNQQNQSNTGTNIEE